MFKGRIKSPFYTPSGLNACLLFNSWCYMQGNACRDTLYLKRYQNNCGYEVCLIADSLEAMFLMAIFTTSNKFKYSTHFS